MRLFQLTDELLAKIKDLIERGLPEYSVCRYCNIAQSTWQLWKKSAKDIRERIKAEINNLEDDDLIALDGTRLNFAVMADDVVIARRSTRADAQFFVDTLDGDFIIVDETKKIEKLIQEKTALTPSQKKMMLLLEICETGKEAMLLGHIDNITAHSANDWKASAWFIERRARREFGRQETVVNKNLNVDVTGALSDEEAQQFKDNLSTVFPNLGGKE